MNIQTKGMFKKMFRELVNFEISLEECKKKKEIKVQMENLGHI